MDSVSVAAVEEAPKLWNPAALLRDDFQSEGMNQYGVIVLNQPIENLNVFLHVCSRATVIVAADGGANRILDLGLDEANQKLCQPHAVIGDLDSVRPEVKDYFDRKGAAILYDADQYSTDFMKCLKYVAGRTIDIVAFGGLGGRADHAFAQLSQLQVASQDSKLCRGDLYLFTSESVIVQLWRGRNKIISPVETGLFAENVGVIPLGNPAIISTQGLEWDVTDWHTNFSSQGVVHPGAFAKAHRELINRLVVDPNKIIL